MAYFNLIKGILLDLLEYNFPAIKLTFFFLRTIFIVSSETGNILCHLIEWKLMWIFWKQLDVFFSRPKEMDVFWSITNLISPIVIIRDMKIAVCKRIFYSVISISRHYKLITWGLNKNTMAWILTECKAIWIDAFR